ncbi:hypothetical protein N7489_003474 [Penicillium chrysogenum]|uniref:Uncharacterized protein n=1 Tax=Penicillium chrysogenum TaxID=5076 RepID=A0ABQ8W9I1_PENCH|nr:uncharacterized protein N7489_003474 [Penicillium chrysogenum]KAJ5253064.1 hypothetical protein N7489_003474 [Penicillium chrysogenum]KAJ5260293.1 hypothetical protein N7505_009674 [Penicillium chrysogenum]KAJ6141778.1 hypothetical protein N7497_010877 [Penicillium chrysogenum]
MSKLFVIGWMHRLTSGYNLGVIYGQQRNQASFLLTTDNIESVEPIDEHEGMWFPLETILSSIDLCNSDW